MSDPVYRPTYANSGALAYELPPAGESALYTVALHNGARFTMLKPGNAERCNTNMRGVPKK